MPRRILQGRVVSDKQDKTVTVLVESRKMHPIFKKYVKQSWKYAAHDEGNVFKTGDLVAIQECAPISKRKTWTVITDPASIKRSEEEAAAAPSSIAHARPSVKNKVATAKKAKK